MSASAIAAIFLLVAANAFFVAAEFGLVAVRRTRVDELAAAGSRRAAAAVKALGELNLMISATQLGITFASLGLGAIGEPALARAFDRLFNALARPFDLIAAHGLAVVIAFAVITALHVVLGELVPKNIAIATPDKVALFFAGPLRGFSYVFRPLLWLLTKASNALLRLVRVKPGTDLASVHTPDELAIIVAESRRGGTIEPRQSEILGRALEFADKRVVDAMIPRTSAHSVQSDSTLEEVLDLVEQTGYSRFPVWRERTDEFVGSVHLKDLLRASRHGDPAIVADAIREPIVVPESLSLEEVLVKMQRSRNQFAIVVDEFGATAGIITLEDVLEELVGEIRDEYEKEEREVTKVGGGLRVPGNMRPDELEETTGCRLPEGEYETVAGFILERLGRLAKRGDEVAVDGWRIRVAHVRRRRILTVDVTLVR